MPDRPCDVRSSVDAPLRLGVVDLGPALGAPVPSDKNSMAFLVQARDRAASIRPWSWRVVLG